MVSKLALGAIWGYQRYLSPYKGFRCAHSVLHGDTGCSGYAKHAIRDHGLWGAVPAIRQRFRDCKDASLTLRANCTVHANWAEEQAASPRRGGKRKNKRRESRAGRCIDNTCDCTDVAWCGLGVPALCAAGAGSTQQNPPVDTPAPSGGADGCSGVDYAAPSCDGCGGCDCSPSCG